MANVMLEILVVFFPFCMSSDVPTFKVRVFTNDFQFWTGVIEW